MSTEESTKSESTAAEHGRRALAVVRESLPRSGAVWAQLAAAALVGAFASFLALRGERTRALPDETPVPQVTLGGAPLPLEGSVDDTLAAARTIARSYLAETITLKVPDIRGASFASGTKEETKTLSRSREDFGALVDSERLTALVRQVRDGRSGLRRAHDRAARGTTLGLPLPVTAISERAMSSLLSAKDELDRPPVDAKYNLAKKTIAPDEPGTRMDVFGTLAKLDAAFQKGQREVEVVVEVVPAKRGAGVLGTVVADDVLGYFETKYARDWSHQARTFNLRIAASKLDGYVLLPGETFDFNEVVGPRTEAYGYKVAHVIAQGELVDGVGGGTCQVAGTLHGAAFFAGLEVVDRRPHTRPSFYIKMGLDAAVAYPTVNLKLKNTFSFPVVLHETIEDGVARAEILGPKRTRDVTFMRKIEGVVGFPEKETVDPSIPKGERVLVQRGIPGFKVVRYRVVREGPFAVRERMPDYYPPTAQIWKVGSGDKDPKFKANDDAHPEYVGDEFLSISQGPNIRGRVIPPKGGGMIESRVPGRYGSYGWTVRAGFSKDMGKTAKPADDAPPGTD
ncbi:MAG: VanW family protein [Polyangiaceae bacterium]